MSEPKFDDPLAKLAELPVGGPGASPVRFHEVLEPPSFPVVEPAPRTGWRCWDVDASGRLVGLDGVSGWRSSSRAFAACSRCAGSPREASVCVCGLRFFDGPTPALEQAEELDCPVVGCVVAEGWIFHATAPEAASSADGGQVGDWRAHCLSVAALYLSETASERIDQSYRRQLAVGDLSRLQRVPAVRDARANAKEGIA